jgi:hypothetical protein
MSGLHWFAANNNEMLGFVAGNTNEDSKNAWWWNQTTIAGG